ncbi:hypothetical protein [Tenacibaculum finnmarkense]|uniref:hypothetical protein n=1 Tax=Tenacibaculum finnmarkense TaxID=2781243 RepID=UPI001EFAD380|nr:hypothetical protein [Tenacibaculum finnmarkense]MCG8206153.1 hypothetical protein [Tenacibaculum finnmarkense genomovar finnmarkense]MCG8247942.1 hypothetical protein [Tenacibaculum finnmarkense genomovar finnmarkense]MCG8743019.1 hypothetical protein [Tenacibaculum finnmarkense]MCG8763871.1 hypothetical protein [Tenacibaculum finnmarkense]MCG8776548.1 hypothetical protein [Tenacibaculum finnmarkense]
MNYHYYNICLRITINKIIQFNISESIRIVNTIENLSDTAKITLPREFKNAQENDENISFEKKNLLKIIKHGDSIKIEGGYNDELQTEFEGYITEIGAEIPLLLMCEDEMYKLKNKPKINKTFRSVNLKDLLKFIAPEYEIQALDMPLGKFTIENATPYQVLENLQKLSIRCYFKNKVLMGGLSVDFKPEVSHNLVFGKNIRNSNNLKYQTKEQRKRFYKGISIQTGTSKKITYEYGDESGDHRTLHLPLNLSENEVKEWVHKIHACNVYDGYGGTLDSWAVPFTNAGDSIKLTDPNYPDKHRDMILFVDSVIVTINKSIGYKRENRISFKIK